jgi:hypothetical protein
MVREKAKQKKSKKQRKQPQLSSRLNIADGAAPQPIAHPAAAVDEQEQQQQREDAALSAMQLAVADIEPVSLGIQVVPSVQPLATATTGGAPPSASAAADAIPLASESVSIVVDPAAAADAEASPAGVVPVDVDASISSSEDDAAAEDEDDDDEDVDNPCPICHSSLQMEDCDGGSAGDSLMVCPCDHVFHTPCLRRWMKQKQECPLCRAALPLEQTHLEDDEEEEN